MGPMNEKHDPLDVLVICMEPSLRNGNIFKMSSDRFECVCCHNIKSLSISFASYPKVAEEY